MDRIHDGYIKFFCGQLHAVPPGFYITGRMHNYALTKGSQALPVGIFRDGADGMSLRSELLERGGASFLSLSLKRIADAGQLQTAGETSPHHCSTLPLIARESGGTAALNASRDG